MSIRVRFFAGLRERLGRAETEVSADEGLTVQGVWEMTAGGEPLPASVLTALNHEYVDADRSVHDGDEVAFFPPVTGGQR